VKYRRRGYESQHKSQQGYGGLYPGGAGRAVYPRVFPFSEDVHTDRRLRGGAFRLRPVLRRKSVFYRWEKSYPWIAAIPITLLRYIVISTLLSAAFVACDNLAFKIPALALVIAHVAVFAVFFFLLLLVRTGKEYIEEIGRKIATERRFIKDLGVELKEIQLNAPREAQKELQTVIDAVRYSDPISAESLATLEKEIQDTVTLLRQLEGLEQIRAICDTLLFQIKDRNSRVLAMK
jgi:hypothetical protein